MDALDPALRPSLSRRAGAFFLDAAFLGALMGLSQWGFRVMLGADFEARLDSGYDLYRWALLTISLPIWSYFLVTETLLQGTLGKLALGMRVREVGAERLGANAAFRRTAFKLLPFEFAHVGILLPEPIWRVEDAGFRWPLLLAYILLAFYALKAARSPSRQGPWDRAAGTYVVLARPR